MQNRLSGLVAIATATVLLCPPIVTKAWTPEPRRTQDNQTAAAPPDISGIWSRFRGTGAKDRGYAPLFLELSPTEPPMTSSTMAKYKANRTAFRDNPNSILSDPIISCFPPGLPRIYLLGFPVQIIQLPDQVIMLFEYDHFVRRIYTDGRGHDPTQEPLWMGDSIGHWEGDTLVTDTTNFNDKTLLDRVGHPHSDAMRVTERIRRTDPKSLEIAITVDDPKAYTKPWDTKLIYELRPDWKIMEDVCEDNSSFNKFNKQATQKPKK